MDGVIGEDLIEHLIAVDAAVDDEGEDALGTPLEAGAKAGDEGEEATAQVVVIIGAFEVDGVALGGVDVVAVDEFVGPSDGGAPAFEDVLVPGVVGRVGIFSTLRSYLAVGIDHGV